jgi:hypothetical protein
MWLAVRQKWGGKGAWSHVEWLLQRPFQNVGEWLDKDGEIAAMLGECARCPTRARPLGRASPLSA